jgi:hypothetical protein
MTQNTPAGMFKFSDHLMHIPHRPRVIKDVTGHPAPPRKSLILSLQYDTSASGPSLVRIFIAGMHPVSVHVIGVHVMGVPLMACILPKLPGDLEVQHKFWGPCLAKSA